MLKTVSSSSCFMPATSRFRFAVADLFMTGALASSVILPFRLIAPLQQQLFELVGWAVLKLKYLVTTSTHRSKLEIQQATRQHLIPL
mmetsp:Transcript_8163/g.18240  ORF Transcript_8163/g.18240 Transcript_8163/m.18240 type:complete len:87 (-) Transcript_8163:21-281(-)